MSDLPTIVLVPGSWHKAICYQKITRLLEEQHHFRCISVSLCSTNGSRDATFKDDLDAVRQAIIKEIDSGSNVIVIAHSYGGLVSSSAISGLGPAQHATGPSDTARSSAARGSVIGLILIATGFALDGLSFMDPFFGHPPPSWRINRETGFAELVVSPRELFYHDLPVEEGEFWVSELTKQSLKSLFEGGEHVRAGWKEVPVWFLGTSEDRALPVVVQRMSIGLARQMGASVEYRELATSHSPFLSRPQETADLIFEASRACTGWEADNLKPSRADNHAIVAPRVRLLRPFTWFKFGLPLAFGHLLGGSILFFYRMRGLWRWRHA